MLAPEQARIALFRISTLGRCQEEKAKNDGGATECCMLGCHLNDLSSCLGNGHLSLASMKVDEDCVMLDARVGSACVDGIVFLSFFFKSKKECRHQHVQWVETGGVQDFDIAFKGRSGEVGRLRWRVGVVRPVRCRAGTCHAITHNLMISCPSKGKRAVTSQTEFIGSRFRCR